MILAHTTWGSPDDPVALIVHGGLGGARVFGSLGAWFAENGWYAIAVDLHGFGETGCLDGRVTSLSGNCQDLVETIRSVRPDVEKVDVLYGHSAGAVTAIVCAVEQPQFVGRVVLEDPAPGRDVGPELLRYAKEIFESAEAAKKDLDSARIAARGAWAERMPPEIDMPAEVAEAIDIQIEYFAAADLHCLSDLLGNIIVTDAINLMQECPVPLIVFVGRDKGDSLDLAEDQARYSVVTGATRQRLIQALSSHTVVELETGHAMHLEKPDEYFDRLGRWLRSAKSLTYQA